MLFVPDTNLMLFLCSPSVLNMDDLHRKGLFLSDIPLHDATRDLVLLSEHFEAEYKLTKNLEILTDKLQLTHRELEDEKKKTDKYVYILILYRIFWSTLYDENSLEVQLSFEKPHNKYANNVSQIFFHGFFLCRWRQLEAISLGYATD